MTPPPHIIPARKNAVLIIEDDPWVAGYVGDVVEAFYGLSVLKAESAETARKIFQGHDQSIAAIISDLSLHGIKGTSLVKELIAGRPEIAVIFVTGHLEEERDLSRAVGREVSLVMKPFSPADLKTALERRLSLAAQDFVYEKSR